jgi:hypothetical protein
MSRDRGKIIADLTVKHYTKPKVAELALKLLRLFGGICLLIT